MATLLHDIGTSFKPQTLISTIKSTVTHTVDNIVGKQDTALNFANTDGTVTLEDILSLSRVTQIDKQLKAEEEPPTTDEMIELLEPFSHEEFNPHYYVNTILDKSKYDKRMEKKLLNFDKANLRVFNRFTNNEKDNQEKDNQEYELNDDDDLDDPISPSSPTAVGAANSKFLENNSNNNLKEQLLNPGKKLVKKAVQTTKNIAKEVTVAGHEAETIISGKKFQMIQQEKITKISKNISGHNEKVLRKMEQVVSSNLITDVYNHYGFFIQTSKHIEKMDGELVELGNLWNEMKSTVGDALVSLNSTSTLMGELSNSFKSKGKSTNSSQSESELKDKVMTKIKDINNDFYNALQIRDFESSIQLYDLGRNIVEQFMTDPTMKKSKEDIEDDTESEVEIVEKFQQTAQRFVEVLLIELVNSRSPSYSELVVKYLTILNNKEESISVYLDAQSKMIDEVLSHISIGDPLALSEELSARFFNAVAKVCENYIIIFGDGLKKETSKSVEEEPSSNPGNLSSRHRNTANNTAKVSEKAAQLLSNIPHGAHNSGFINWVVTQTIEKFCMKFKKGIGPVLKMDFKKMTQALTIAFRNSQKMNIQGLSVQHLLTEFFRRDLEVSIQHFMDLKASHLTELVTNESWKGFNYAWDSHSPNLTTSSSANNSSLVFITDSGKYLYKFANEYVEYLKPVANVFLYQAAVNPVKDMLEEYILDIFKMANTHLSDQQFCCMICNLSSVRYHLLPKFFEKMKQLFGIEMVQFSLFLKSTHDINQKIIERFCDNRIAIIMDQMKLGEPKNYPLHTLYSPSTTAEGLSSTDLGKLVVSSSVTKFVSYVKKSQSMFESFPQLQKQPIAAKLLELYFKHMLEIPFFWNLLENKKIDPELKVNPINVLQLNSMILDLVFIEIVCNPIMDENLRKGCETLKTKMVSKYCALNGIESSAVLKEDSYFALIVKKLSQENDSVAQLIKFFKDFYEGKDTSSPYSNNSSPSISSRTTERPSSSANTRNNNNTVTSTSTISSRSNNNTNNNSTASSTASSSNTATSSSPTTSSTTTATRTRTRRF
ncbi:predicted protein [Naegleria gruberi]|uniref:Predicted protein n=1 Tax=Naegleria gruberi TaxID=5762 RepID=D2V845_NAEGR|nr:uncharacterized protein NAEGRDRAFT_47431 [Naegleria gruberi]EFC47115.1 predicted protein [Naegleria gruberi]|eukprot:XP_002679859.1 predicted protein [Naegleria gruberi strain NEG-M]